MLLRNLRNLKKRKVGLNAWKVEPELADRFLNVLADKGYRWFSGSRANELKNWNDDEVVLIIEVPPKRIAFMQHSLYMKRPDWKFNVTEVTEEWLRDNGGK